LPSEFVRKIPSEKAQGQRETLLYFVHPDSFEPISSQKHKERIATVFQEHAQGAGDDVDRRLLAIRRRLESQFGIGFSFYKASVKTRWQKGAEEKRGRWDDFVGWIRKVLESQSFDEHERDYKLPVAQAVREAQPAQERDAAAAMLRSPGVASRDPVWYRRR
jgi:hypothetical protein